MLKWNTVSPLLKNTVNKLMAADELRFFRLVGGTSLSLQLGHRKSEDIDLFTDQTYGSVNFAAIDQYLKANFAYTDNHNSGLISLGTSYFIGNNKNDSVKLDLYYTDTFIRNPFESEHVRMGSLDEIVAMKINVISRIGRKKDFWDLHELSEKFSIQKMLELHQERHPYEHNEAAILEKLINFDAADNDFEPMCLRNKYWEVIKLDFIELVQDYKTKP